MKLFFAYLKTKRHTLEAILLFTIIFTVSFALFRLPIAAVLYPAGICFSFGCIFIFLDFLRIRKKCAEIEPLCSLPGEMIYKMPTGDTLTEEVYTRLIQSIRRELLEEKAVHEVELRNMVDYYTIWVHQIKTPISVMKLTLQNEDSNLTRQLRSELFRIQQYVDMVLAYLRLDSDSTDYVFREYTVDDMVRPSVRKFASEFIGRKLSLQYHSISTKLVTDEKWFSFVFEQLLSNALKYTRQGGIRIYLAEENTLCLADTGIGIAPEDLPRIFEKGYTGYNGRADKSASGLGLYLCRRICDRLGIGLTITSESNKGTQVFLTLPPEKTNAE